MDTQNIAALIRFHRKKSGLSQAELAQLAGLGKTVIFDIEKGKLSVRLNTLLKVLEILNIQIEFHSPLMLLFQGSLVKKAKVFVNGVLAGELQEVEKGKKYSFEYLEKYNGPSVSLTMPITQLQYVYNRFPPFFEGLLPEGIMLESLLYYTQIDRNDLMAQLIAIGQDMVGNVTIEGVS